MESRQLMFCALAVVAMIAHVEACMGSTEKDQNIDKLRRENDEKKNMIEELRSNTTALIAQTNISIAKELTAQEQERTKQSEEATKQSVEATKQSEQATKQSAKESEEATKQSVEATKRSQEATKQAEALYHTITWGIVLGAPVLTLAIILLYSYCTKRLENERRRADDRSDNSWRRPDNSTNSAGPEARTFNSQQSKHRRRNHTTQTNKIDLLSSEDMEGS